MAYIQGEDRTQGALFPVSLDDLIPDDHLVRVIEAYILRLDLQQLGFSKSQPKATGRPPYNPADLLKLYIYGYFHRIRSSRRLEAEAQRNVEVMWLLGRLTPDFKTIADFRRDNGPAFTATCRAFVQFCRRVGLIAGELVAIDGSKFQVVASNRKHITPNKLKHQEAALEKRIARYLAQLDETDRSEGGESVNRSAVQAALRELETKKADNQTCQALMEAQGLTQHVLGEPEARKMRTAAGKFVAYNIQSAVDAAHCLIFHHEVTQDGTDNQQLEPMAKAAKAELAQSELTVTADAGYSNGEQFQACEAAGITAFVPANRSVNPTSDEVTFFGREDFVYNAEDDQYRCPAGKVLTLKQLNKGARIYHSAVGDCSTCPLKPQCTKAQRRYVSRHAQEEAFERMEKRMRAHPEMMVKRRSIVEHPFGNLKQWLFGNGRFLVRHLRGARAEMSLAVLGYNLKRALKVLGASQMRGLMS
ncbi:IS1182 family transposase [Pseudomonas akapageensis]|uniref:IS1182 family transposase n=1 Tax=Pseudomonas akapageensis TaxID=2609961 RepID=UPI00140CEA36|nr:IS1182 family transposase [Pseudomonas akapageensis]